ncbi:unnamed protein product [Schistosoma margrebowiei]|uniref:Uncharacterized protein n=1 Tax=Schistosoma margrebowiei TaxID=48269 RepID=A0A183LJ15_9TREM|nr:unnamed protein product [Schistosoma margrebowiei]
MQLDDLKFANDIPILYHAHEQIQIKTTSVAAASALVGLNIHKEKCKILKCNTEDTNEVTLDVESLREVETSMYLGSIINERGGSYANVSARINKLWFAFLRLKNI